MKVTTSILRRIMVSFTVLATGAAAIHHFQGTLVELDGGHARLRERAELAAHAIEGDLRRLERPLEAMLAPEFLTEMINRTAGGDRAEIDAARQLLESRLLQAAAMEEAIDGIQVFDAQGRLMSAVVRGSVVREGGAIDGQIAAGLRQSETILSLEHDGFARLTRGAAPRSPAPGVVVSIAFDFSTLTAETIRLLEADTPRLGVTISQRHSIHAFSTGTPLSAEDAIIATTTMPTFPATLQLVQERSAALAAFREREASLLLTLLGLWVAVLVLFWSSFQSLVHRPVQRMRRLIISFEDGKALPPPPTRGGDELARLERAIHRMIGRWKDTRSELESLAQTLETRIETRTQALNEQTEELQNARLAAESASRYKSDFLANMSHEIRTPMTAMLGYTELLADPAHDRSQDVQYIETIRRNGEHLLTIINDILDLSKIESGRMEVESITCSPWRIVEDVRALMAVRARDRKLKLIVRNDGLIPETIRTDPTRLRQILTNLISNAIKFTRVGKVELVFRLADAAWVAQPRMEFEVIDTGIGMDDRQQRRLFTPFVQADTSTTRKFGGTGLGLAISRRLAQLLGGDITVETAPGVGSTFCVAIETGSLRGVRLSAAPPEGETPAPDIATAPAEPMPIGPRFAAPIDTGESAGSKPSVDEVPAAIPASAQETMGRVLVAEDGVDNQKLLSFFLRKGGYEVSIADNGRIACEMAIAAWREEGRPFDVILMDMQMPEMDGYTATATLREQGYAGPIVALTAHAMISDRERCLRAGCDEFATKPIDRATLLNLVAAYTADVRRVA